MSPKSPSASLASDTPQALAPGGVIEQLSLRYRAPLRRFFEKRGIPRHEIDDLVQDVFLRLASRESIGEHEHLDAYLFRSALNLLTDRHRRRAARASELHEVYEEEIHGIEKASFGPDRQLLGAQDIEQLVAALYELPERTRAVFTLHHIEDLSHQEIADRLGIAISTIEKHMGRASAFLIKRLERQL